MGDIDAFLKVQRPDSKSDGVGLKVLDEPCAAQSEPAVLHLQLRALTKQSSAKAIVSSVGSLGSNRSTLKFNCVFFYILFLGC